MAFIPFISIPTDDQETDEPSNVVAFPALISAQERLRSSQRALERTEQSASAEIVSRDDQMRAIAAQCMLPFAREDLKEAETAVAVLMATDKLTHRGVIYQALRSSAGAN